MNAIIHDVLAAAKEDHESVIELTRDLVTIPSRGGVDPYESVLDRTSHWLEQQGLPATVLKDATAAAVGLTCEVTGSRPGPRWVLDACLDTAPFGDEHAWTYPPTAAVIKDGWLYGRGSVKLHVHGIASHSGGSKTTPSAVEKAAHLIRVLSTAELPDGMSADFPLTGKLTDTAAHLLEQLVAGVDDAWPGTRPTLIQIDTRWPAYALNVDSRLRTAILDAAKAAGVEAQTKIAGPSNIGNYLAGLGIPATAGFGVAYTGLHGTDERIQLDTIPTVQATYHSAVLNLTS